MFWCAVCFARRMAICRDGRSKKKPWGRVKRGGSGTLSGGDEIGETEGRPFSRRLRPQGGGFLHPLPLQSPLSSAMPISQTHTRLPLLLLHHLQAPVKSFQYSHCKSCSSFCLFPPRILPKPLILKLQTLSVQICINTMSSM